MREGGNWESFDKCDKFINITFSSQVIKWADWYGIKEGFVQINVNKGSVGPQGHLVKVERKRLGQKHMVMKIEV